MSKEFLPSEINGGSLFPGANKDSIDPQSSGGDEELLAGFSERFELGSGCFDVHGNS